MLSFHRKIIVISFRNSFYFVEIKDYFFTRFFKIQIDFSNDNFHGKLTTLSLGYKMLGCYVKSICVSENYSMCIFSMDCFACAVFNFLSIYIRASYLDFFAFCAFVNSFRIRPIACVELDKLLKSTSTGVLIDGSTGEKFSRGSIRFEINFKNRSVILVNGLEY